MNKTREFLDDIIANELISDCCGAPIILKDICLECKEHCDFQRVDEE